MLILLAAAAASVQPLDFDLANIHVAAEARAGEDYRVQLEEKQRHAKVVDRREIAWQVLNLTDLGQTIYWCGRIAKDRKCEANPMLGRHPSTEKLVIGKAASGVVHYLITRALKDDESIGVWQWSTLVIQGGVVAVNFNTIF